LGTKAIVTDWAIIEFGVLGVQGAVSHLVAVEELGTDSALMKMRAVDE
jgi:hypothetical protein